jgi:hypothetical protein
MTPETPPAEWLEGPSNAAASPGVAAIYDDIAAHLRVPFLGSMWRALALEPEVLAVAWQRVAPVMPTRAFEDEAEALRRTALIEEAVGMPSHQAFKADLVRAEIDFEMRERISNYNHAVEYGLARTLLAAAWLSEPHPVGDTPPDSDTLPIGVAPGAVAVPPLTPAEVRGRAAELLVEIPRAHGHPIADEYFRALGRIPDYLGAAWNPIKPVVRDPEYDARGVQLAARAREAARRLPGATATLTPEPRERFAAVLGYFVERHLPDVLLDAAMIKAITDGPDQAFENRFARSA